MLEAHTSMQFGGKEAHPVTTALVVLPVAVERVRLAMHTDAIEILMRHLRALGDARNSILIEGRILTPEQAEALANHPTHKFFLSNRIARVQMGDSVVDMLTWDRSTHMSPAEARVHSRELYTPSSLAEQLGYQVGFYRAADLIRMHDVFGKDALLPILGGVNAFQVGTTYPMSSDSLNQLAQNIADQFEGLNFGRQATYRLQNLQSSYYTPIRNLPIIQKDTKNKLPDHSSLMINTFPMPRFSLENEKNKSRPSLTNYSLIKK